MIGTEKLLTPRQVADLLTVSETKVWLLTKGGELPGIRVGRSWRYRRADLEKYLDSHLVAARLSTPDTNSK